MIGDYNFWEDVVKNYISSVATGITLLIIGAGGYVLDKKYSIIKKFNAKSENLSVGNVEGDMNVFQEVNKTSVLEEESKDTTADT